MFDLSAKLERMNVPNWTITSVLDRISLKRVRYLQKTYQGQSPRLTKAELNLNWSFLSTNLFAVELCGSLHCCHIRLVDPALQPVPGVRVFLGVLAYHHLLWSLEFPAWFHLLNLQTQRLQTRPEISTKHAQPTASVQDNSFRSGLLDLHVDRLRISMLLLSIVYLNYCC